VSSLSEEVCVGHTVKQSVEHEVGTLYSRCSATCHDKVEKCQFRLSRQFLNLKRMYQQLPDWSMVNLSA